MSSTMAAIFALGSNGSGQLGIGHKEDVSVPKPVLWVDSPPAAVTGIAAGGNHTLLLTGDGQIYWSGDPTSGSCGRVPYPTALAASGPGFRKMVLGKDGDHHGDDVLRVDKVAATWEASIFTALDDRGKSTNVFSCGIGEKGELGQGALIVRTPLPGRLPNFPPANTEVVDLCASMGHVAAVLSNGEVYGWGNGRKGQLGSPAEVIFAPRRIEGIGFKVQRAVCGKDFTCLLGESGRGEVLVLGSDKWDIKSTAPSAVPDWVAIEAGWNSIFILKSDGDVLGWGRDDYAQVSQTSSLKVAKLAAGSEHVVALLRAGDVLSWGWGEHGNCGPLNSQGETKGQRNTIASSKYLAQGTTISAVGAGCATSWIFLDITAPAAS